MEAPFKVGQRVVAIADSFPGFESSYKKGYEFTVSGLVFSTFANRWNLQFIGRRHWGHDANNFAPIEESKERIRYVAVSETLREQAVEIAAIETN